MHKFISLSILVFAILVIDQLKLDALVGIENYTLLVLGFLIFGGILAAEIIAALFNFPRVTGYVLTGVFLGPHVFNILSLDAVNEMKMFNSLAIGLIAFTAGLELGLKEFGKVIKTILATTMMKLLLLPIFVGGSIMVFIHYFPNFLSDELETSATLALALVFSTLCIGTSPAIVIAISSELKKSSRLLDIILGAAIIKDLIVIVSLAVSLAIAKTLVSGLALDPATIAFQVGREISISAVIGTIFGVLSILYVRYINHKLLLFILFMILVVAELCHFFHGELLLSCIVAGFTIRNFSLYEHDMMSPLKLISMPTFIIFFTIVGASIDLQRAAALLPLGLLIFFSRALVFYFASHIGGRIGNESDVVQKRAWLGYLPQAGVTLSLVAIASSQMREYSVIVSDLGLTLVSLNLFIGPIALRFALNEKKEVEHDVRHEIKLDQSKDLKDSYRMEDLKELKVRNLLIAHLENYRADIAEAKEAFATWFHSLMLSLNPCLNASNSLDRVKQFSKWRKDEINLIENSPSADKFGLAIENIFDEIGRNSSLITFEMEGHFYKSLVEDSRKIKIKKMYLRARLFCRLSNLRSFSLQTLMLKSVGFRYSRLSCECAKLLIGSKNEILYQCLRLLEGDANASLEKIHGLASQFISRIDIDCDQAEKMAVSHFAKLYSLAGSPYVSNADLSIRSESKGHALLAKDYQRLAAFDQEAKAGFLSEYAFLDVSFQIKMRLSQMVEASVLKHLELIKISFIGSLEKAMKVLGDIKEHLRQEGAICELNSKQAKVKLQQKIINSIDISDAVRGFNHFLADSSPFRLASQMRKLADLGDQSFYLFVEGSFGDGFRFDRAIVRKKVDLGGLIKKYLLDNLLQDLEDIIDSCKNRISGLQDVPSQLASLNEFASSGDQTVVDEEFMSSIVGGLDNSSAFLSNQINELNATYEDFSTQINTEYLNALDGLFDRVRDKSPIEGAIEGFGSLKSQFMKLVQAVVSTQTALSFSKKVSFFADKYLRFFVNLKTWFYSKCAKRFECRPRQRELFTSKEKIRLFTEAFASSGMFSGLNPLYVKAFSLRPLRDNRLFVGRKEELGILNSAVNGHGKNNTHVLLVASSGSGLTSLLNNFCSTIEGHSLFRFEPQHPRLRGLVLNILADEFDCHPTIEELVKKLNDLRPVVIIDDLQRWALPHKIDIFLEQIGQLFSKTKDSTTWVIGLSSGFYKMFGVSSFLEYAFDKVVDLDTSSVVSAKEVILKRLKFSGVNRVEYSARDLFNFLDKIGLLNSVDYCYEKIGYLGGGNISHLLSQWLKHSSVSKDGVIARIESHPRMVSIQSFYSEYKPFDQAVLHMIFVYGELRINDLLTAFSFDRKALEAAMNYLESQKQVIRPRAVVKSYVINPVVRNAVKEFFYGK